MKNKHGFSLVELLVVIVIMGILATIAIGTFQNIIGGAQDAKRQANVKSIYQTIMANQAQEWTNNKYKMGSGDIINRILIQNDITLPENDEYCYFYFVSQGASNSSTDNEFVVLTWSDSEEDVIAEGTSNAVDAAQVELSGLSGNNFVCSASENDIKNSLNMSTSFAYKIKSSSNFRCYLIQNKSACNAFSECSWNGTMCQEVQ